MSDKQKVYIKQYDDKIVFTPVVDCIRKKLSIWERTLEGSSKLEMFAETDGGLGVTYPGFCEVMVRELLMNGYEVEVRDRRSDLPDPELKRMSGFRFSQEQLITTALKKKKSGLVGAPTRYGKTTLMINTLRAFPTLPTVVVAPGVDLVNQLYDDITGPRGITGRDVKKITGSTSRKIPSSSGVTVCTIDALEHVDAGLPRLLLADEPHALVTDKRLQLINKFTHARRIGFGATLEGRFDGRDKLITGAFGPILANRTYKEAVAEGAVCQLHVLFLKIELTPKGAYSRNQAYNNALFLNKGMADTVASICKDVIPADYQTLVFIANKAQADLYLESIGHDTALAMAMVMSNKQREALVEKVRKNNIKRCLCTNIFVQGVTFSDLKVLVNCNAGAKYTSTIQKPGRLAEIRPGKKCGIVIDFMFTPPPDIMDDIKERRSNGDMRADPTWLMPYKDSMSRKGVYKKMGYGIHEAENIEELKQLFNSLV